MRIEYIGYGSCSGTGIAAKDYVLALDSIGVDVAFRPIDSKVSRWFMPWEQKRLTELRHKKTDKNWVQVFHCIPDMQRRFSYCRHLKTVGFATYESTKAPSHWKNYLIKNDLVIVPSEFCYNTFDFASNLSLVPHCCNVDYWKPRAAPKNDKFTFVAIGSWMKRKGWDELAQAWCLVRGSRLKIVTDHPEKARIKFGKFDNVSYHSKIQDMAAFMSQCDCVVCPTKGEGFGLVGMQALALGLPLIITEWSGVKEYANKDTACMLPIEKTEVLRTMDGIPQFNNREWPVISPEILRDKMEEVRSNYIFFKNKAQRGCQIVRDRLSYDSVGARLQTAIESIT